MRVRRRDENIGMSVGLPSTTHTAPFELFAAAAIGIISPRESRECDAKKPSSPARLNLTIEVNKS
jgi:hypothetical protein